MKSVLRMTAGRVFYKRGTVEPGYYGHQGDIQKCPYCPGVRIKPALRKNVMDSRIYVFSMQRLKQTFLR